MNRIGMPQNWMMQTEGHAIGIEGHPMARHAAAILKRLRLMPT